MSPTFPNPEGIVYPALRLSAPLSPTRSVHRIAVRSRVRRIVFLGRREMRLAALVIVPFTDESNFGRSFRRLGISGNSKLRIQNSKFGARRLAYLRPGARPARSPGRGNFVSSTKRRAPRLSTQRSRSGSKCAICRSSIVSFMPPSGEEKITVRGLNRAGMRSWEGKRSRIHR